LHRGAVARWHVGACAEAASHDSAGDPPWRSARFTTPRVMPTCDAALGRSNNSSRFDPRGALIHRHLAGQHAGPRQLQPLRSNRQRHLDLWLVDGERQAGPSRSSVRHSSVQGGEGARASPGAAARAAVRAAQRGEEEPQPAGLHRAQRYDAGALAVRPQHRRAAVRVGGHRRRPRRDLRCVKAPRRVLRAGPPGASWAAQFRTQRSASRSPGLDDGPRPVIAPEASARSEA